MPLPYHGQIAISAIVYSSPAMNWIVRKLPVEHVELAFHFH
jgi:hypothetical protein